MRETRGWSAYSSGSCMNGSPPTLSFGVRPKVLLKHFSLLQTSYTCLWHQTAPNCPKICPYMSQPQILSNYDLFSPVLCQPCGRTSLRSWAHYQIAACSSLVLVSLPLDPFQLKLNTAVELSYFVWCIQLQPRWILMFFANLYILINEPDWFFSVLSGF